MKPHEINIGNYLHDRGGKVLRVDFKENWGEGLECKFGMNMEVMGNPVHPLTEWLEHAKPIPITEDLLNDLGFQKTLGGQFVYPNPVLTLWTNDGTTWHVGFWQGKGYKYIHELQNLFLGLGDYKLSLG